jgi:DNA-binding transcriptional regulator LsrR (DeoR family)
LSVELKALSKGARSVFDYLLKSGGGSQASLSAAADISQPQVARLIKGLQEDGLVELTSRKTQRRGNPSVHVALNPDHAYGMGIAITDDTVSLTLLDFAGRVRASATTAPASMNPEPVLQELLQLQRRVIDAAQIDAHRIVGAGVGFAGYFVNEPARGLRALLRR